MKTQLIERNVAASGIGEFEKFKIEINSKSFKILLDGLYSNKIRAVIRELWTNAYDAHIAVGKEDVPFDCHLPGLLDPTFWVRDYGVSMTHDEVMTLYSTVFKSSKDTSNEQVGMFGLGSKSVFAYTDTFVVTAYLDGELRQYLASLDTEGVPQIALVSKQPTDEPQGLKVSFSCRVPDFPNFTKEASIIALGFATPPLLDEIIPFKVKHSFENWSYYDSDNYDRYSTPLKEITPGIRQGCVVYPLPRNNSLPVGIVVDVPIGTVNITANREMLSFDPSTSALVDDLCKKAKVSIEKYVTDEVNKLPNLLTAIQNIDTYRHLIGYGYNKILFRNKPIPNEISFEDLKELDMRERSGKLRPTKRFGTYFLGKYKFVVVRKDEKVKYAMRRAWEALDHESGVILKNPTTDELRRIVRRLGLRSDQVISAAALPMPIDYPPKKQPKTTPSGLVIPPVDMSGIYVMRSWGNLVKTRDPLPPDYYWIPIERGNVGYISDGINHFFGPMSNWDAIIDTARNFELIEDDLPVYFLTPRPTKKAKADRNLSVCIDEHLKNNTSAVAERYKKILVSNICGNNGFKYPDLLLGKGSNGSFYMQVVSIVKRSLGDAKVIEITQQADIEFDKLRKEYPMLFIHTDEDAKKYINMIKKGK